MDVNYIGNKIADLRKQKKLTQKELGDMIGVSYGAVSKWERCLNYPDIELLQPLANALDTSVSELMGLQEAASDKVIEEITTISIAEKNAIKIGVRKRSLLMIILSAALMVAELCAYFIASENNLSGGIYGLCTLGVFPLYGYIIGSALYSYVKLKSI